MEPLLASLFVLAIIGCLWMTVYAVFVRGISVRHTLMPGSIYRSERQVAIDKILHDIVVCDAYHEYMQPLFYKKLKTWGLAAMSSDETINTRDTFIKLHEALILDTDEYALYKTTCKNAIENCHLWIHKSCIDEKVEDMCCNYMFHDTHRDELWTHMKNIHMK